MLKGEDLALPFGQSVVFTGQSGILNWTYILKPYFVSFLLVLIFMVTSIGKIKVLGNNEG
jgi:hypothetical protein